jgi:Right handed beta helix region
LIKLLCAIVAALALLASTAAHAANTIRVGPLHPIKSLKAASVLARDGDTVEVEAGIYAGDVSVWTQNDLTIRGVKGRAVLDAAGKSAQGKAILVLSGDRVAIENIEFTGCKVPDKNGAGIRQEGASLIVRNSVFRDSEAGILVGDGEHRTLEIYNSQFMNNGDDRGYAHHVYAGQIAKLKVEGSYFTQGRVGHLLKSRAKETYVFYNRLTDESGRASYELDLPNGGLAYVMGNIIEQGPRTENPAMISFGVEGLGRWARNELILSHNTMVNNYQGPCRLVKAAKGSIIKIYNTVLPAQGCEALPEWLMPNLGNAPTFALDFRSPDKFDYTLLDSTKRAMPVDPAPLHGVSLKPTRQYRHPAQTSPISQALRYPGAIQPY